MARGKKQDNREQLAIGAMMFAAVIWGSGFIVTRIALNAGFSTVQLLFWRFAVAALFFGIAFRRDVRRLTRQDLTAGIPAGLLLFFGFLAQTLGLRLTTPARNAFITATYVVIVPFMGWLFARKKPGLRIFAGACCSLLGIGLLSLDGSGGQIINAGDGLTLLCALCFAAHFIVLERAVHRVNTRILLFLQMAVTTVCSLFLLPLDAWICLDAVRGAAAAGEVSDWLAGAAAIAYLAVFSSGVAYFIQTTAQKYTSSAKAAIILAAEALWGSLFSLLFGFEPLTPRLIAGGLIIFLSVLLIEMPVKVKRTIDLSQPPAVVSDESDADSPPSQT